FRRRRRARRGSRHPYRVHGHRAADPRPARRLARGPRRRDVRLAPGHGACRDRGRTRAWRRLSAAAGGDAVVSAATNPVPKLAHGWPFVLLDRVLETDERRGVFLKLVTASDPCVGPDGTLPAAFVLEALAQAGGALLAAQTTQDPTPGYLAGVDDFRVIRPV